MFRIRSTRYTLAQEYKVFKSEDYEPGQSFSESQKKEKSKEQKLLELMVATEKYQKTDVEEAYYS